MNSIVLINCYFGPFPNYFNLFLDSCRNNPSVDFLFFTDNKIKDIPPNVTFVHTSFKEIKKKIQDKFDFEISLDAPYKLCDYKPAYGFVFSEFISEHDFWGYCDVDMIFGDIRHFLREDILNNYDKFYKLGHLTVFRNSNEINKLFMKDEIISYKEAFSTAKIAVFDEFEGIQKIFDKQGKRTFFSRDYADITTAHNRFMLSGLLADEHQKNNYSNQVFTYESGHVYRYFEDNKVIKKDEFIYIHLQKRKFKATISDVNQFFVTYKGFIPMDNDEVSSAIIRDYNGIEVLKEVSTSLKRFDYKFKRKISKMRLSINEHCTSPANR